MLKEVLFCSFLKKMSVDYVDARYFLKQVDTESVLELCLAQKLITSGFLRQPHRASIWENNLWKSIKVYKLHFKMPKSRCQKYSLKQLLCQKCTQLKFKLQSNSVRHLKWSFQWFMGGREHTDSNLRLDMFSFLLLCSTWLFYESSYMYLGSENVVVMKWEN